MAAFQAPTVFVVDDDEDLRDALCQMLGGAGLASTRHADGESFLASYDDAPGCVLLDMAMPGMDGMAVQQALKARGLAIPVVFLTGHGDIPLAVKAMQAGAVDYLEKPVQGSVLLERVRRALELDRQCRAAREDADHIRRNYARLSPREREVMALIVRGMSSKVIAQKLGLSPRTVDVHRIHIMYKMGADSLPELVRRAAHCDD